MANRTVKDAQTVHGTNPQYLVEKIIRSRVYDSQYWKDQCFALTAELLVDKAMELRYIGGVYGGNIKPCPFLCLTLKMLQIQPDKDIVIEFIKQDDYKYVRALGAFYLRLVHSSLDCYKYLEPLLNDYRKLRIMTREGKYVLTHMDDFIDTLLRDDRVNDIMLPRIQKRWHHETNSELEPRISLLDDDLDELESESEDEDLPPSPPATPPHSRRWEKDHRRDERNRVRSPGRTDTRSNRDRTRRRSRSRDRHRDGAERKRRRSRSKERSRRHKSPGHHRHKRRDRDRSRDRDRDRKRRDRGEEKERSRGDRDKKRDRDKKKHRKDRENSLELEIAEANALRAKLGMQPLKR